MHVNPDAKGAVQKQRRVSLPLKTNEILDKWEEMDVIDVGDEPTEWCSNVGLTPKKDGEIIRAGQPGHEKCQEVHKENQTSHLHTKRTRNKT